MIMKYSPCLECLNRYKRQYSKDCDDTCDYAHAVKLRDSNIADLNTIIANLETQLTEEKSRNAKLVAQNAILDYDLGHAYQIISKLKGDHYV